MRCLIAIAALGISLSNAFAEAPARPPAFTHLKEAFAFIDNELDKQKLEPFHNFYGIDAEFLKLARGNGRLLDEVRDKEFPSNNTVYGVELLNDRVYAQFSKSGRKWHLDEIRGNK